MRIILVLTVITATLAFGGEVFISPTGDVAIEEGDTLQITLRDGLAAEIYLQPVSSDYTSVVSVSEMSTARCSFDTSGIGVGRYFLVAEIDGETNVGPIVSVSKPGSGIAFSEPPRMYVQPNPFDLSSHSGTLTFVNIPSGATAKIYDMAGKLVTELAPGEAEWNGRNDRGDMVASGTYMFYVEGNGLEFTGKFAVIK
ncbi:MAG: T9SS type A sorting domain-containing protein [bacterium]|nr:T9SS type A sorting domain-containing protein [bacterium]